MSRPTAFLPRSRRFWALPALLVASFALAACGGGGGGGDDDEFEDVSMSIVSSANRDGLLIRHRDGDFSAALALSPFVGDAANTDNFSHYRALYTFDLSQIPADAEILSAELRITQRQGSGDPTGEFVHAIVDHVNVQPGVEQIAFNGFLINVVTGANGLPVPLTTVNTPGLRTLDVTSEVADDIDSGRSASQYRIRTPFLGQANDATYDFFAFFDGQNGANADQMPTLEITYRIPTGDDD